MLENKKIQPIDLTDVLADYEGKWVVLSNDLKSVLSSGDNIEEIIEYVGRGVTMKVSDFVGSFTP